MIDTAEEVRGAPDPTSPISIRLSTPLLERLDRIAAQQHRKRSNLIQHVLWEYVHAHAQDVLRTPASKSKQAALRRRPS
ncbi:MAG: hypothetical protein JO164_01955 [Candidatus Eremiobacteraeota bacterium]|nr:hypothetical protein [Candidatus Eremiobacteraeota bacterium]